MALPEERTRVRLRGARELVRHPYRLKLLAEAGCGGTTRTNLHGIRTTTRDGRLRGTLIGLLRARSVDQFLRFAYQGIGIVLSATTWCLLSTESVRVAPTGLTGIDLAGITRKTGHACVAISGCSGLRWSARGATLLRDTPIRRKVLEACGGLRPPFIKGTTALLIVPPSPKTSPIPCHA